MELFLVLLGPPIMAVICFFGAIIQLLRKKRDAAVGWGVFFAGFCGITAWIFYEFSNMSWH